jgi:hypothetical protein
MVVCCSGVYAETCPAKRTRKIIIMPLITSHPQFPIYAFITLHPIEPFDGVVDGVSILITLVYELYELTEEGTRIVEGWIHSESIEKMPRYLAKSPEVFYS